MKKYINFLMLALSITCNLQASLPVKYWNDNVHKPKSTIQKNISLTEKCKQTVAMIKERKTVNLEKTIPLLMEVYTKEIHTLPEVELTEKESRQIQYWEKSLKATSVLIIEGAIYETCKKIINKEPELQKRNISLYYIDNDDLYSARTALSVIQFGNNFTAHPDAANLYSLHHELQHQRNGINHNRTYIAYINNKSQLAGLQQTPYVRSILKSNIRNSQGQNLQDLLEEDGSFLKKEIMKYEEFRADTKSLQNIHCPHCVKEASMSRWNDVGYRPDGYINQWQFQPRIEQLKKQGTICQHHHENGEQIDTSICDGSTLKKRMVILDKKNI